VRGEDPVKLRRVGRERLEKPDTSHLRDIQRTGDTSLVSSRGAGVALLARVLHAGSSDETWSVWMRETSLDNAKRVNGSRGVAYNGSHRWSEEV
jgi:hypothetical protein